MSNIYLISDTHFGHQGICNFLRNDGKTKLRPWDNYRDMDEALIENWNKIVKPFDKVYHFGDFALKKATNLNVAAKLNGTKFLILGNHDDFNIKSYVNFFDNIMGTKKFDCFTFSHYPVHYKCISGIGNMHGHIHEKQMLLENGDIDKRYLNLSVECINYTPISYEEAKKTFQERLITQGVK